jgi:hypothetical protein
VLLMYLMTMQQLERLFIAGSDGGWLQCEEERIGEDAGMARLKELPVTCRD